MEIQGIDKLVAAAIITGAVLISPLIFIGLDFCAGTRKAKERKEDITSDGWQRTVNKISRYYNALFALLVIDAIQMCVFWYIDTYHGYNIPVLPFLTSAGAVFVGIIEVKSIYESADSKVKKQTKDVTVLVAEIIKNNTHPDKIAKAVVDYLNENKNEINEKEEK